MSRLARTKILVRFDPPASWAARLVIAGLPRRGWAHRRAGGAGRQARLDGGRVTRQPRFP